jgi:ectoine hydroxylase-related dioxygenase (phytanoyl-CoA dioxygenase family)
MSQPKPEHLTIPDTEDIRALRARLESAGYAVLPEFVRPDLLAVLRSETQMLCSKPDAELDGAVICRDADQRVLSMHYLDRRSGLLFDLARLPQIQQLIDELLVSRSVPFLSEYFCKPVAGSRPTPPHQDQIFNRDHFGEELAVTMWIALTDVDENAGVLQYATQQPPIGELLEHKLSDLVSFDAELIDGSGLTYASAPVPAGGAVIHHSYAVHRSGPMSSAHPRTAVALNWRRSPYRERLNPLGAR